MAKTVAVMFATLLLVIAFVNSAAAAVSVDGRIGLAAERVPANPYHRGCSKATQCRGGPGARGRKLLTTADD